MKIAKKLFLLAVAGGFIATSCGDDSRGGKVVRMNIWDTGRVETYLGQVASDFMKLHPDIKIQVESVPEGFQQAILVQLAGGSAPDIFQVGDNIFSNFQAMGAMMDLTPFINGDNPLNLNDFMGSILDNNRVGDGIYALPADFTTQAVYYNKDIFDEAGIAYPTEDWTWDEFRQIAKQLTVFDADGNVERFGARLSLDIRGILPLIYAFGGDLISPDGDTVLGYANGDATVTAMEWVREMIHTDKSVPSAVQSAAMQGIDLFLSGMSAMYVTGSWPASEYAEVAMNFGTVTLPSGPAGLYGTVYYSGYAMSKDTKYPEETWLFLRYLATEGRYIFAQHALVAYMPASIAAGQTTTPYLQPFIKMADFTKPFPELLNPEWLATGGRLFNQALEEISLDAIPDMHGFLNDTAKESQAAMEEQMGLR